MEIHEEIHVISEDDSHRRVDIVAIDRGARKGLVLGPTVRFERDVHQAAQVNQEKKAIYEPCLPYLADKFQIPLSNWTVIGLLFGARGSASKFTVGTLKSLKMTVFEIDQIVLQILKDSLQILRYHLYFNN